MSRNPYDDEDAARFATSDSVDRLADCFTSPNETDSNGETANVVDGLFAIARAIGRLADVIEKAAAKP